MDDTTIVALNLIFLMTLGIGFMMFLGHVLVFTTFLILVGAGRFVALGFTALGAGFQRAEQQTTLQRTLTAERKR